jgi:pyruvate/2-oxoglutarate dehydrogenase complex dihydrolipoamide dehydrogenase (E3) component/uncharacterized membrane protein YdjX (TVP38/TMEM64 family)
MSRFKKPVIFLAALVALVAAFVLLDLPRALTLQSLKASLDSLREWRQESPLLASAAFFGLYVLLTALSVPEAALLTLAAGALFGLLWGVVLVSFASSLGALGAFAISRHLARDTVQRRFGDRLKAVNEGVAREGASYLFTLRLVPIVPFFLINLLMGLTPMSPLTFYVVSQVGMLPGTIVYVNAGTQLASIDSPAGIVSPGVLLSFALLGVFPWLAKRGLARWRRRAVYGRFKRPKRFDRNLVVIGGGAGGLVSAYIGAAVKASVSLVESGRMGGDCLNYGCVPSKALIKSARIAHQMRHADRYGLRPHEPADSFRQVIERIQSVIRTIEPHDSVDRYTSLGVDVVQGHARIVDPWTVDVTLGDGGVRRLTTRSIVIATGASPAVPVLPGLEEAGFLTTDTMWDHFATLDSVPRRLVLLGGGPIGCELAQALARLGCEVTVVEMGEQLLAREDSEVSDLARAALEADGVVVRTAHKALRCETRDGQRTLVTESQGASHSLQFDVLICAIGRTARLKGYGLEELGIKTDRTIVTNEYLETLYPNIFAAGDVAGPYQFTHTAAHQAWYAAVNALFGDFRSFKADYRVIPRSTFIDPEVARVGLSEAEAKEQKVAYEVTRYSLSELDRAIADSATQGFVKVLTPPGKDRILGVTIVGEHASELLAEFVLAMKWGIGLEKILSTIHTYPTMAEASKYAAGEWKRAHAPQRVLRFLAWFHARRRG